MSIQRANDVHIYKISDVMSYIMNRYIQTYEDFVYKNDEGKYVFTKLMSDKNIFASFNIFMRELIHSDLFQLGNRNTVIVSSGYPFMNWRRSFYSEIKESNRGVIDRQLMINYVMNDRSIKIDEYHLCNQINNWVINMMGQTEEMSKTFDTGMNMMFFMNKNVNEVDIINIIKNIFGESRVTVKDIDCIKSIGDFSEYTFSGIGDHVIPNKVSNEINYFITNLLNMSE